MSDRRPSVSDVQGVLRHLGRSPAGTPDAAWRARLRTRFVGAGEAAPRARALGWGRRGAAWTALAAAAALLIVFVGTRAGPDWQVAATSGQGMIGIGDAHVPAGDSAALARVLRGGAVVDVPESAQLDLALPGSVLVQIPGGTRVTLPSRAGRWLHRDLAATLARGGLRVATGPAFHDRRLTVVTDEARAVVTGTTLAVLRGADSTCVCVFEGRVVMAWGTAHGTIEAGTRQSVFRRSATPRIEPIRPMETMKLSMLRDRASVALRH